MIFVKVFWKSLDEGGKKYIFPGGWYYPIVEFGDIPDNSGSAWSFKLNLGSPYWHETALVSEGVAGFLMEDAPVENIENNQRFILREGGKVVAHAEKQIYPPEYWDVVSVPKLSERIWLKERGIP